MTINLRRREKFVLVGIFLSLLLFVTQSVEISYRYFMIVGFGLVTYFVSAWSLADDLQKHEWLTILPIPTLYGLSISVFNLFVPTSWWSKVLLFFFFAMGMYAILLSSNIFSVAKARTIQLYYAAQTISLFFILLISFLLTSTVFMMRLPIWLIVMLIGVGHFPLVYSAIWSVRLESKIDREELLISLLPTLVVMQLTLALSFLPLETWTIALLIMSVLYLFLNFTQSYLKGRLFEKTIREYLVVAISIYVLFLLFFPGK